MGTYLTVLRESYSMNNNMTGLDDFLKSLRPCALDERSLRIGRVDVGVLGCHQIVFYYGNLQVSILFHF